MFKSRKFKKLKKILKESGLFDSVYYLKMYHDARIASETPLDHFVKVGLKEDRKPNKDFDPKWYREYYEDVKKDGAYPFIHYILFGQKEKRYVSKVDFEKVNREMVDAIEESCVSRGEISLIAKSDLFDSEYYINKYPDVAEAKIDPISHYLDFGWKELRNPSAKFDTEFYLNTYEDVKQANINPLVHYLRLGEKEGRLPCSPLKTLTNVKDVMKFFHTEKVIPLLEVENPIDVLIPVYNGYEYLEPLFHSIVNNTFTPYRLLICDDKSPDERVYDLLKDFENRNSDKIDIVLLQNEENKGFVGTINRLVSYTKDHFVILNTDTEVPPFWLERLMYPIFKEEKVATTTPFTNAGTICSFPNYLEDNPIFKGMPVDEIDAYFQQIKADHSIEIPTGVGFCMGVNRELVEQNGIFDVVFGKGYGEENDFCQKAIQKGYRNLHIPNLFVYHKHGGSFPSETKKKLIENNSKILLERYPDYNHDVQKTIQEDAFKHLREFLKIAMLSKQNTSYLFFDHNLGGGANHYLDQKIEDIVTVSADSVIVLVKFDYQDKKGFIIECIYEDGKASYYADDVTELERTLKRLSFDEIFVNSFVSYADVGTMIELVLNLKHSNQASLIVPIHDYFPLCPSYTLLNEKTQYCGVPDNFNRCVNCLLKNRGEFKQFETTTDIERWRQMWLMLLEESDEVLCFSNASKEITQKAYPTIVSQLRVIPHDISGRYKKIYDESKLKNAPKVIGILGGINIPKGAFVIKDLVQYIDQNKLDVKVVLIGDISEPIESPCFYKTGRYKQEELPHLVRELGITEFLIPSIWPETFSYTTDEIMQMGYPLTVFNLGAPAERVQRYMKGRVVSLNSDDTVVEVLKKHDIK